VPTFVTLAAARIQPWLLRTPDLKGMRGASLLLAESTDPETISTLSLRGGATAQDAGRISGVVALEFETQAQATAAIPRVLDFLVDRLPGVEWEGWWCTAPNYSTADAAMRAGGARHDHGSIQRMPALRDFTVARACTCQREPARPYAGQHGEDETAVARKRLGPDCHARDTQQRRERKLSVNGDGIVARIPGRLPVDFDELARLGGVGISDQPKSLGRKGSRNHLATIVADGNAIGGLFDLLARSSRTLKVEGLQAALVKALNTAVEEAVVQSARAVSGDDCAIMGVIPHYMGGDDIFVSVPAVSAWRFCARLAETFTAAFDDARAGAAASLQAISVSPEADQQIAFIKQALGHLSLGIGMCIAHASHPISEAHEHAEAAMKEAKKQGKGAEGWIGWVDLTAGPPQPSATWHGTIPTATVHDELHGGRQLPDVFALGPSARSRLTTILRDQRDSAAVENWGQRVGWPWPNVPGRVPTPYEDLGTALSRARWAEAAATEDTHQQSQSSEANT